MTTKTAKQSTAISAKVANQITVDFGIADATISDLKHRYTGLKITDSASYKIVQLALGDVRTTRTGVEKSRIDLKAEPLDRCKRIDAEAKRVTALLLEIETPLQLEKDRVDKAKDIEKQRVEEEQRAKAKAELEARQREERERMEAAQAKLREEQEVLARQQAEFAEQQRLAEIAAENKRFIEQRRLDDQRAEMAAAKAAAERVERERQAAILAEQRAAQEIERQRLARIVAEQDAAAEVERQRQVTAQKLIDDAQAKLAADQAEAVKREQDRLDTIEAERVASVEKERQEAERQAEIERLSAIAPDCHKLRDLSANIRAIQFPKMRTKKGQAALMLTGKSLLEAADYLDRFADENEVKV